MVAAIVLCRFEDGCRRRPAALNPETIDH